MRTIISLLVLLTGCATVPDAPGPTRTVESFPEATRGIAIPADEDGTWTLDQLLREYEQATGQRFLVDDDTRRSLQRAIMPSLQLLEIPAEQVHSVVETILVQDGFVFAVVHAAHPRLVSVKSRNSSARYNPISKAHYVPVEELEEWGKHPAYLIHTVLSLDAIDVRTLTNSMRAMITDNSMQSIVPAGSAKSVMLTGTGPQVLRIVRMLEGVDETERARLNATRSAE